MAFSESLSSFDWWASVVAVSLALNVFAAYLLRMLDAGVSAISRRWSMRSARAREDRAARIQYLRSDPEYRMATRLFALGSLTGAVSFLVLAVCMFLIPTTVVALSPGHPHTRLLARFAMIAGIVLLLMATRMMLRSARVSRELTEALASIAAQGKVPS
jgi:hypothetical protein